ncbi:MAG TPA: hypothetical protein VD887_11445 [Allosphingosinicella sp.]|nr:hypothetical protein [Allosphingosinicella sp.]
MSYPPVAAAKDVKFNRLVVEQTGAGTKLIVGGLVFHSSLAVKHVNVEGETRQPNVMVYLTPAKRGLSGTFIIEADLPDRVDCVSFGPDAQVIWSRASSTQEG